MFEIYDNLTLLYYVKKQKFQSFDQHDTMFNEERKNTQWQDTRRNKYKYQVFNKKKKKLSMITISVLVFI